MSSDLVGRTLFHRYRVVTLLGRGGMAEVYRAYDLQRDYPVAIKILREDLSEDREFVHRFRAEAHTLSRLAHVNIVRFYDFIQEGPLAFLVMDYVPGTTLRRRLNEAVSPLPPTEILAIVRQIGAALAYAHREGFIHRDVKPGNIMLAPDGKALLSDFGVAKLVDSATVTSAAPGTPAYMSPEQILGRPLDQRTDIYSFGVVLYEMIAGRRPFVGDTIGETFESTRERVQWEHLNIQPPDPRRFNVTLPQVVVDVALKALAKDPTLRWGTIKELLVGFEGAYTEWGGIKAAPNAQPTNEIPSKPRFGNSALVVALLALLALGVSLTAIAYIARGAIGTPQTPTVTRTITAGFTFTVTPSSPLVFPLASTSSPSELAAPSPSGLPSLTSSSTFEFSPTKTPAKALLSTITPTTRLQPTSTRSTSTFTQQLQPTRTSAPKVQPTTARSVPTLTPQPAPAPEVTASFSADSNSIGYGSCTVLRWATSNVRAVYLDGQGVIGNDSRIVCPSTNRVFVLRVEFDGGSREYFVTIEVVLPSATPTVPPITLVPPTATNLPPTLVPPSTPTIEPTSTPLLPSPAPLYPTGDINRDCIVNEIDQSILLSAWSPNLGDPNYDSGADLNGDGKVDEADLSILLLHWGQLCT